MEHQGNNLIELLTDHGLDENGKAILIRELKIQREIIERLLDLIKNMI